jgi:hypothetical protein
VFGEKKVRHGKMGGKIFETGAYFLRWRVLIQMQDVWQRRRNAAYYI